MKLVRLTLLALCLQIPISHANDAHNNQCSIESYVGCGLLMGSSALLAAGAYLTHTASKDKHRDADLSLFNANNHSRTQQRKTHATQDEIRILKIVLIGAATALGACGTYCLNSCLNK